MDSMYGMKAADLERWSDRVVVVRGLNPGPFTGPGTNTYLVGTGARPLLIDTGVGHPDYPPLLERAFGEECSVEGFGDVLVTHVHPDHLGGAPELVRRFGPRAVSKLPWPGRDERFDVALTAIGDGTVIRTEGATLRAIHTPGHAQDHLCFYLEEDRALFTGDLILGAGTTVIPIDGGDMAQYLASLEMLLDLDLAWIYPGHGPRIAEPHARIRLYLEHRLERERQVLAALERGVRSVPKIVEQIYVETPRALWAAAGQSVLSHLLKLERERRVARALDPAGEERWALV
jgi:ribonuclease/clavin/mitogillin